MPDQKPLPTPVVPDYSDLETERQLEQSWLYGRPEKKPERSYGQGELYKRPGSSLWWASYYIQGIRHRESTGLSDRRQAERWLNARLAALDEGRANPRDRTFTFEKLLQLVFEFYQTHGRRSLETVQRKARKHLLPYFGQLLPGSLTTADIEKFKARRRQADASPAEINRELSILSKGFNLALDHGLLQRKPTIRRLTEGQGRTGILTRGELDRVLLFLPAWLKGPALFCFLTSWRLRSEVLSLLWSDVNVDQGVIILRPENSKNAEARPLPYAALPELEAIIEQQKAFCPPGCPYVFCLDGKAVVPDYLHILYRDWRAAAKQAGIPGRTPHDLRRSAITELSNRGIDTKTIAQLSGHKTLSMVWRYQQVNQENVRHALASLSQKDTVNRHNRRSGKQVKIRK